MEVLQRALLVFLLAATAVVALAALASIGLQAPWLRGRLADLAESQAGRLLAADLQIGRLGGNLLFGATLEDVVLSENGKPVVTIERVEVDYDAFGLASGNLSFPAIRVERPHVRLDRGKPGFGLSSLFLPGDPERKGPGRTLEFDEILVIDGTVSTEGRDQEANFRLPERISDLNAAVRIRRTPGRTAFLVHRLSFHGTSPELFLAGAEGRFVIAGDDLVFDRFQVELAESRFTLDGKIHNVTGSGRQPASALRLGL